MESIGTMHVLMRPAGSTSRQDVHLIDAEIILDQATIFIVLSTHEGPWPFSVENKSNHEVTFGQIVGRTPNAAFFFFDFFTRYRTTVTKGQRATFRTK